MHRCLSVTGLHSTGSRLGHHTSGDWHPEKLLLVPFTFFSTLTTILMDGKMDSLNTDEDYARTHSRCNNWHRQIIVVQNKRQHEEVNVAPMTGQQDYRVLQDSSL